MATVPGWPQLRWSRHRRPERYVLPLAAFPPAFQADAELWLDRLAGKAGLDVGPVQPLRPATLDKWRFAIRQLASALVLGGRDLASLAGLADLVTPEAAEAILRFFLDPRRRQALRPDPGARRPPQGDCPASCRGAPEVLDKLRRMAAQGDAAAAGHDRQEPRRPAPVRRARPSSRGW